MVYFEQLRLLIVLLMAYLSYRNISHSNAIEQYDQPIEDEVDASDGNSQLQSESVFEDGEQIPPSEKESDEVKPSDEVPVQSLPQSQPSSPPILSEQIIPERETNNDSPPALSEVDQNNTVSKIGKRKMIKKTWKREKKQNQTETMIGSQEQVESEMDESKENQMIDI